VSEPLLSDHPVSRVAPDRFGYATGESATSEFTDLWRSEILHLQDENGAFRISSDPTDATQAWTSAQCVVGLLSHSSLDLPCTESIFRCFSFLETARTDSKQGGWGIWERSEFPLVEVTAWVSLAYILSMREQIADAIWKEGQQTEIVARIRRDLDCNLQLQNAMGGWTPIQGVHEREVRTYSTTMALWSELAAFATPRVKRFVGDRYKPSIFSALHWFKKYFRSDLGAWIAKPSRPHHSRRLPGLTAQILYVLSLAARDPDFAFVKRLEVFKSAKHLFLHGLSKYPVDIESTLDDQIEMQDQAVPPAVQLEGSTFLAFPWTLRACQSLKTDTTLSVTDRNMAASAEKQLRDRLPAFSDRLLNGTTQAFEIAESLIAIVSDKA
jgi:hypothetical protein